VKVHFKNKNLRKLFEVQSEAKRALNKAGTKKLAIRRAELDAAVSVTDLRTGDPHELIGDRTGQYSVDIDGGPRLLFEPAHETRPTKADGGIDWARVTEIRIIFIGDHHD
jgi:proteic killer suppression protein